MDGSLQQRPGVNLLQKPLGLRAPVRDPASPKPLLCGLQGGGRAGTLWGSWGARTHASPVAHQLQTPWGAVLGWEGILGTEVRTTQPHRPQLLSNCGGCGDVRQEGGGRQGTGNPTSARGKLIYLAGGRAVGPRFLLKTSQAFDVTAPSPPQQMRAINMHFKQPPRRLTTDFWGHLQRPGARSHARTLTLRLP